MNIFLVLFIISCLQTSVLGAECAGGWTRFERASGPWCVRVFYGVFVKDLANEQCTHFNAVLSGVENAQERMSIADAARSIIIANRRRTEIVRVAGLWLGASQNTTCIQNGQCTRAKSFQWTDGNTSGTDGLKFPVGQPSGVLRPCLQQLVFADANTYYEWPGYQHGDMAETSCAEPMNPSFRMYACGKNAGVL